MANTTLGSEYRYWMTNAPIAFDLTTTDTAEWVTPNIRLVIMHDELAHEQIHQWEKQRFVAWRVDS